MMKPTFGSEKHEDPEEHDTLDSIQLAQLRLLFQKQRTRLTWVLRILVLAVSILIGLSTWLGVRLWRGEHDESFARGFKHELGPAKHLIELQQKMFTGSPHFRDDGFEYVPEPADGVPEPKYVGEPSKEIDHNWSMYHWGRFFLLTEDEAREAWGPGYKQHWSPKNGGYIAALEVMHTIHCLDHLRKAFYPDIYPPDSPVHGLKHRDHCINHLRQVILCNSDLTPIPSRFYIGIENNYIDSDQPHTCRNFDRVRDWVSERFNGSLAVMPEPGTISREEWKKLNGIE